MTRPVFEVAIESIQEANAAASLKANRVEVCSALDLGGLTPSFALIEACGKFEHTEAHVMIRPRAGSFLYSNDELNVMKQDIVAAKEAGAHGIVFGALTKHNELDVAQVESILETAKSLNLETTFHRAFDFVPNPLETLDTLVELGVNRILTSGQKPVAIEGIDLIAELVQYAQGRIQIMAGSGVNSSNAQQLLETGIDAIHFTARKRKTDTSLNMGVEYEPDEGKITSILNSRS